MSSGTNPDGTKARAMVNGLDPVNEGGGPPDALTPRQLQLDWYWRFYRASTYDGYAHDWNGQEAVGPVEHDMIAHSGIIPPGFYDAGQTSPVPLKFRKPSAPYYLGRVIPKRFTSLLFGAKRHPRLTSEDQRTEDWLAGFAEATRLWAQMIQARAFGGAMGAVGLGFKFVRGKPVVEVFDPRWCFPEFSDRELFTVANLEIRYTFVKEVRNRDGAVADRWFWYRRLIDGHTDIVWPKVAVDEDGEEPVWEREVHQTATHNFGFCPVVWVQNQPVDEDIDGDPDCHGIYDLIQRIDTLYSQADRSTVANCDPALAIASDADFSNGISKGTGRAIQTEASGKVSYVEMTGAGIDRAITLAEKFEEKALNVACCVLDRNEGGPSRTAEEVEHNYSAMLEQADIFREQYGERGVKRLLELVLLAARKLTSDRQETDAAGVTSIVREVIRLPLRRDVDPDTGEVTWAKRELGSGEQVELVWPDYFTKSQTDIGAKVDAAGKALTFGLVDQKHATEYVADEFSVANVKDTIDNIQREQAARTVAMGGGAFGGGAFGGGDMASKVAERTQAGAKSALPNPTAKLMPRGLR